MPSLGVFGFSARLASAVLFAVLLNSRGAFAEKNYTSIDTYKLGVKPDDVTYQYIVVHALVPSSDATKSCTTDYQLAAFDLEAADLVVKIKEPFACWLSAKFDGGAFKWEYGGVTHEAVKLKATANASDATGTVFGVFNNGPDTGYDVEPAGTQMTRHTCCMKLLTGAPLKEANGNLTLGVDLSKTTTAASPKAAEADSKMLYVWIGVGCFVGLLAVVGVSFFVIKKLKKKKDATPDEKKDATADKKKDLENPQPPAKDSVPPKPQATPDALPSKNLLAAPEASADITTTGDAGAKPKAPSADGQKAAPAEQKKAEA